MARVFIPASLRPLVDKCRSVELPGETVRDVVLALEERYPALVGRLREGDRLKPGLAVSIDSSISRLGLKHPVTALNEVHFIAALSGG